MKCQCGGTTKLTETPISDGRIQLKAECALCGSFLGWAKKSKWSYKERLFFLVKKMANCQDVNEFYKLKSEAVLLITRGNEFAGKVGNNVTGVGSVERSRS